MKVQCLLFVVQTEPISDSKELLKCQTQVKKKAYVLCPFNLLRKSPKVFKIFTTNGVQILDKHECPSLQLALERGQAEIVELIVTDDIESKRLQVCVQASNRPLVSQFIPDSVFASKTNVSSTNIRVSLDEGSAETIARLCANKPDHTYRNPKGGTLLHLAVGRNNAVLVRSLLRIGANVNAPRNDGSTPLHLAVQKKNVKIISLLLKSSADVNARKGDGRTCLLMATEAANAKVVGKFVIEVLLEDGASANIGNCDGLMPIHVAAKHWRVEIVEELLLHGASVNVSIARGQEAGCTPLWFAVSEGRTDTVKLLLKRGADINVQYLGATVFSLAVQKGYFGLVREIVKRVPDPSVECNQEALRRMILNERYVTNDITKMMVEQGFTLNLDDMKEPRFLHRVVCGNHLEVMAQLSSDGADVNARCEGATLLHFAVEYAGKEMVELLLTYGADMNAMNSQNRTPIHCAIADERTDVIKLFMENSVGIVNYLDYVWYASDSDSREIRKAFSYAKALGDEKSPPKDQHCYVPQPVSKLSIEDRKSLREVVFKQCKDSNKITKSMLEQGCSVTAEDTKDPEFLLKAIRGNHLEVVSQLLSHGADPNVRFRGITPLHMSVIWASKAMHELLIRHKADLNALNSQNSSPFHAAIATFQTEVVELFLENDADVNRRFEYLCYAVEKSSPQIVETFLQKGVGPDHKSRSGSVLVVAADRNNKEIVEVLLKYGANVGARNQSGETALHVAARRGSPHILRILIGHNADVEARCSLNKTPILNAAEGGHERVVRFLLTLGASIDFSDLPAQLTVRRISEEGHHEVLQTLLNFNFTSTKFISKVELWKHLESAFNFDSFDDLFQTSKQTEVKRCLKILVDYAIMASEANLYDSIAEEYPKFYVTGAKFRLNCEAEIQQMKTLQIGDLRTTMFDVLTANEGQLGRLMQKRAIRDVLYTGTFALKYPLYAGVLQHNFQRGMSRRLLLKRIIDAAYVSLKLFSDFPYEVMEQIFDHLSIKDIGWLVDPSVHLKIAELDNLL